MDLIMEMGRLPLVSLYDIKGGDVQITGRGPLASLTNVLT